MYTRLQCTLCMISSIQHCTTNVDACMHACILYALVSVQTTDFVCVCHVHVLSATQEYPYLAPVSQSVNVRSVASKAPKPTCNTHTSTSAAKQPTQPSVGTATESNTDTPQPPASPPHTPPKRVCTPSRASLPRPVRYNTARHVQSRDNSKPHALMFASLPLLFPPHTPLHTHTRKLRHWNTVLERYAEQKCAKQKCAMTEDVRTQVRGTYTCSALSTLHSVCM